uniref:Uncharacterized protein n=1 Tax=Physcomitrium patens TaxID=3218 RepID=A0A2K1JTG8_PHYPA|nr:hypothetical protein PHYPA_014582 [Physcomitrium patens]
MDMVTTKTMSKQQKVEVALLMEDLERQIEAKSLILDTRGVDIN